MSGADIKHILDASVRVVDGVAYVPEDIYEALILLLEGWK